MIYETIEEISISEFKERAKHFDRGIELSRLLFGLCGSENWREAQDIFIDYLSHPDVNTISTAVIALSRLARLSGRLEKDMVIKKLLETAEKHPSLAGRVEDVLEDLAVFTLRTD